MLAGKLRWVGEGQDPLKLFRKGEAGLESCCWVGWGCGSSLSRRVERAQAGV